MSIEGVELTLPGSAVHERTDRFGGSLFEATLPEGTVLDGRDLTGARVTCRRAWADPERLGIFHLVLEGPEVVLHTATASDEKSESDTDRLAGTADALALGQAVIFAQRVHAGRLAARAATSLIEQGELEAAARVLEEALTVPGLSITVGAQMRPSPEATHATDTLARLEAASVLGAYLSTAPCALLSEHADVDTHYDYVAFSPTRCVSRTCFATLLADARRRPPAFGGALDEHSIAHVTRALAEALTTREGRVVALVNGKPHDVTDEIRLIEGLPRTAEATKGEGVSETIELGEISVTLDLASLASRHALTMREAHAFVEWLQERLVTDVTVGLRLTDSIHLTALLRSEAAVRTIVASGIALENSETGEWVALDARTGALTFALTPDAHTGGIDARGAGLLDRIAARVATDDRWCVDTEATGHLGPAVTDVLARACRAWRTDATLTQAERTDAWQGGMLTRERLAVRTVPPPRVEHAATTERSLAAELAAARARGLRQEDLEA